MPVHPEGTTSSAWYSSAASPTAAAFTRSGMSLVTSTTSPRPAAPPLGGEVERAGEDPAVVGVAAETGGEHLRVGVVELDVQGGTAGPDRDRGVEAAVQDAQLVELAQRGAGEPAELGVVTLALQFGDDHQREDHLVPVEPGQRPRVGQQDRGVEHVTAGGAVGHGCSLAGAAPHPRLRWAGRPWRGPRATRTCRAGRAREGRVPALSCEPSAASGVETAQTPTRASPGGPHRLRPATADDIGGRPGAVNSNTDGSTARRPDLTRRYYRSSLDPLPPVVGQRRCRTSYRARSAVGTGGASSSRRWCVDGVAAGAGSHRDERGTLDGRDDVRTPQRAGERGDQPPGARRRRAAASAAGGPRRPGDVATRRRAVVVEQQRRVQPYAPQRRQDGVEPLGELDRRAAPRPPPRTCDAHGPQLGADAVSSAALGESLGHHGLRRPEHRHAELDAVPRRRRSRPGCTPRGARGRSRAPQGAAAGPPVGRRRH